MSFFISPKKKGHKRDSKILVTVKYNDPKPMNNGQVQTVLKNAASFLESTSDSRGRMNTPTFNASRQNPRFTTRTRSNTLSLKDIRYDIEDTLKLQDELTMLKKGNIVLKQATAELQPPTTRKKAIVMLIQMKKRNLLLEKRHCNIKKKIIYQQLGKKKKS